MAYPFVSNSLYEHRQEEVIYEYQKETDKMDTTQIHQMLKEAEEYNVKLKNREAVLTDPFDPELAVDGTEEKQYEHLMDPENDGIMGFRRSMYFCPCTTALHRRCCKRVLGILRTLLCL